MPIIRSWRLSGVIAVRGIVLWLCRQSDPVGWLWVHWGVVVLRTPQLCYVLPNGHTTSQPDLTAYTATALYHARRSHHSVVSSWWWTWNCPKHVEQFIKRNNVLYNVTSSWFCYLHWIKIYGQPNITGFKFHILFMLSKGCLFSQYINKFYCFLFY